jgi:hypothetical protein
MKSILLYPLLLFSLCLYSPFSGFDYSVNSPGLGLPDYYCLGLATQTDCKTAILVNEINEKGIQLLQTKRQMLIERGNYKYAIEFIHDERGLLAKVYSINGVSLKKGDEVFFMSNSKDRVAFRFIEKGKASTIEGVNANYNVLKLDSQIIHWFATAQMTTVYIKDNTKNEMRKFTLSEAHSMSFSHLSTCFKSNLKSPD